MIGEGKYEGVEEKLEPYLKLLANHIIKERQRLGGDFVIAQAIFSRKQRNLLQEIIGSDLVFMVLNIPKESQVERLKKRHADSVPDSFMEFWFRYAKMCEPAGDDEKNSFNIEITKKMARKDVINQILKFADKV